MKRRLLVVEDSDLNRDLLVQLLEDTYELELAEDGETAVKLAAASAPDLILMDIALPGLSGLDAVRAIRALDREIPIVAVSSHVMPGDAEEALAAGSTPSSRSRSTTCVSSPRSLDYWRDDERAARHHRGVPARILIVDDEPMNVGYLEQELEGHGFSTETAANGLEALSASPPSLPTSSCST